MSTLPFRQSVLVIISNSDSTKLGRIIRWARNCFIDKLKKEKHSSTSGTSIVEKENNPAWIEPENIDIVSMLLAIDEKKMQKATMKME